MAVHNEDIAAIFDELANLLELKGDNPFKVRAYRNAARTIRSQGTELAERVSRGEDLTELPGIGKEIAAKIIEIVATGKSHTLQKLRQEVPPSLEDLLQLPGLGPKRVKTLYETRGIKSLDELANTAKSGRLRELPGFGPKTEQRILEALAANRNKEQRFLFSIAGQYAEPLRHWLQALAEVKRVVIAGSYRRGKETVGDLDILAIAENAPPVMQQFTHYEEIAEVVSSGSTRATVILRNGLQVDLRVVSASSFGAALHYFTGSRAHSIEIRRRGQQLGLKINEYGVFKNERRVAGLTEESVFESVGLPFIEPELRENRGEIEAAREGRLPRLIELHDLRGDLHCHTQASDGQADIAAMANAARAAGLQYLAITDHSHHLRIANGLDEKRLAQQMEIIDAFNEQSTDITLLKGIEVDILEDGRLDLPDSILSRLDLVIGAVHDHFNLSEQKQTDRILKAMDHRYFTVLAHPTGRLLLARDPYPIDMVRVIEGARERGCYLELNAQPKRLDLNDIHCRMARDEGVKICIDSDSHSPDGFANLAFGIHQARRGWLEKEDILNTADINTLKKRLRATMA